MISSRNNCKNHQLHIQLYNMFFQGKKKLNEIARLSFLYRIPPCHRGTLWNLINWRLTNHWLQKTAVQAVQVPMDRYTSWHPENFDYTFNQKSISQRKINNQMSMLFSSPWWHELQAEKIREPQNYIILSEHKTYNKLSPRAGFTK